MKDNGPPESPYCIKQRPELHFKVSSLTSLRTYVAGSFAASGIDANVSVGDGGTVGLGAFGVGDAWDIDFTQDGGDTQSI